MIAMLGNVLTAFGTTPILFCIFRFISGLATDSNFVMMYILGKFIRFKKPIKFDTAKKNFKAIFLTNENSLTQI